MAPTQETSLVCKELSRLQDEVDSSSFEHNTKQDLSGAIQTLVACSVASHSSAIKKFPDEVRVVFSWPRLVPRRFPDLTKASHPIALIVVAYYGYFIQLSSQNYWFLQGWSQSLETHIVRRLAGSSWEEAAQWPLRMMGNRENET